MRGRPVFGQVFFHAAKRRDEKGAVMGFLSGIFGNKSQSATESADAAAPTAAPAIVVTCPVAGEAIDITEVNDAAFASKAMGDGIAIKPAEGTLVAPISGTVEALFPTGHALAIKGDNGVSILLHIGIDTVEMKGDGFNARVAQGDHVEQGQLLVEFDLDKIAAAGFEATTMVLAAECPAEGTLAKCPSGPISLGDRALWFA